jgi:murein DD-endopeptidase MepM/ murein hydrolase activator NlpD
VAVADGVVLSAGTNGNAGRMVHIRHANGFETQYLHLSAISLSAGTRVRQGEIIGRVGATGLATGPHLDYRVKERRVVTRCWCTGRCRRAIRSRRLISCLRSRTRRLFDALGAPAAESRSRLRT